MTTPVDCRKGNLDPTVLSADEKQRQLEKEHRKTCPKGEACDCFSPFRGVRNVGPR
jgi:hypothetical protein